MFQTQINLENTNFSSLIPFVDFNFDEQGFLDKILMKDIIAREEIEDVTNYIKSFYESKEQKINRLENLLKNNFNYLKPDGVQRTSILKLILEELGDLPVDIKLIDFYRTDFSLVFYINKLNLCMDNVYDETHHTIEDLVVFVNLGFNSTEKWIAGKRLTIGDLELKKDYHHPHLPNRLPNDSITVLEKAKSSFNTKKEYVSTFCTGNTNVERLFSNFIRNNFHNNYLENDLIYELNVREEIVNMFNRVILFLKTEAQVGAYCNTINIFKQKDISTIKDINKLFMSIFDNSDLDKVDYPQINNILKALEKHDSVRETIHCLYDNFYLYANELIPEYKDNPNSIFDGFLMEKFNFYVTGKRTFDNKMSIFDITKLISVLTELLLYNNKLSDREKLYLLKKVIYDFKDSSLIDSINDEEAKLKHVENYYSNIFVPRTDLHTPLIFKNKSKNDLSFLLYKNLIQKDDIRINRNFFHERYNVSALINYNYLEKLLLTDFNEAENELQQFFVSGEKD